MILQAWHRVRRTIEHRPQLTTLCPIWCVQIGEKWLPSTATITKIITINDTVFPPHFFDEHGRWFVNERFVSKPGQLETWSFTYLYWLLLWTTSNCFQRCPVLWDDRPGASFLTLPPYDLTQNAYFCNLIKSCTKIRVLSWLKLPVSEEPTRRIIANRQVAYTSPCIFIFTHYMRSFAWVNVTDSTIDVGYVCVQNTRTLFM